jgi:hypothetical protein
MLIPDEKDIITGRSAKPTIPKKQFLIKIEIPAL